MIVIQGNFKKPLLFLKPTIASVFRKMQQQCEAKRNILYFPALSKSPKYDKIYGKINMKIKTIFRQILQFVAVIALMAGVLHLTALASSVPISDSAHEIYEGSQIPTPPKDMEGSEILETLVIEGLRYVKLIIVVIGILYITIMGYSLVTSGENEENVTTAKRGITYAIIAFVMISMSQEVAQIFDMKDHSILESPQEILKRVRLFDRRVEIVVTFIKYVIGSYAVLMIVRSGFKLITAGNKEEEVTKHKASILYSGGGLLLIYIGDIFINKVFYKIDRNVYSGITGVQPKVDAQAGIEQIKGITNFVVSLVGPIAVLILIVGAILYATAGGEQDKMDKAKRLIMTAAIGILIIYGAFAIVSTIIAGKLQDAGALLE